MGAGVDVLRKGIAQPHGRGSLDGEGNHSDPWVTAYLTPLHQHNMQSARARGQGPVGMLTLAQRGEKEKAPEASHACPWAEPV